MKKVTILIIVLGLGILAFKLYKARAKTSAADSSLVSPDKTTGINKVLSVIESQTPDLKVNASGTNMDQLQAKQFGFVYVSNSETTTVSKCPIIDANGTIGKCLTTGNGFVAPSGISLVSHNQEAYIANDGSNSVSLCTISNTGDLVNCNPTGNDFSNPSGIATDNQQLYSYVTNQLANTLSRCKHLENGELNSCKTVLTCLSAPTDINFDPSNSYVYIANSSANSIWLCKIDVKLGVLSNCHSTGNDFADPQSVTINPTGQYAYITNQLANTVSLCMVDQTSGELQNCSATGGGFHAPSDFTFNGSGSLAFISNPDSISVCQVGQDGKLGSCTEYEGNFNHSTGIRIIDGL